MEEGIDVGNKGALQALKVLLANVLSMAVGNYVMLLDAVKVHVFLQKNVKFMAVVIAVDIQGVQKVL